MGFNLGKKLLDSARCVSDQNKWEALSNIVHYVFGDPAPSVDGPLEFVIHNSDDDTFTNINGDVLTVTGGAAVVVKEEGSTVVAASTILDFYGPNITVTDGTGGRAVITVDVSTGVTQDCIKIIQVDGSDTIEANDPDYAVFFSYGPGITITSNSGTGEIDWNVDVSKVLYSGQAVGAVTNADATCFVDNVTTYNGIQIVGSSADQIRVRLNPRIKCADNTVILFEYSPGILGSPATDYTAAKMLNWKIIWAGIEGYDATKDMLAGHKAGDSDLPEWDTVANWIKTLPGYNGSNSQYLKNAAGTITWVDTGSCTT